MAHPRRFRFGLQGSNAASAEEWANLARRAEDLGFSTLFLPDHFSPQLAPIPAMMAAADATTELRVGSLVLDNDYRHPVVLAKEIATLDVLSGGRVEFGLGAGWMRTDYEQAGIPFDDAGRRIDRFEEGLTVIEGMFADGPFTFAGEHYTITALEGTPKPVQRPRPPLLIGAGGPRLLGIAGRRADIVGINPTMRSGQIDAAAIGDATAESFDAKVARLRQAAGDRFDDLELSCLLFFVAATDDRMGLAATVAPGLGLSTEEVLEVPLALIGSVDEMCEALEARRQRWGLSYFCCQTDTMDAIAPVVARLAGR